MNDSSRPQTQERPRGYGISLDGSLAHEHALLNSQITALDEALVFCDKRDQLEKQAREVLSARQVNPRVADRQFRRQEMQIQRNIATTQQAYEQAQRQCETFRKTANDCEVRVRALEVRELTNADRMRIQNAENAAQRNHASSIQRLKREFDTCTSRLTALQGQIATAQSALTDAETELAALTRDEIPPRVQDSVIDIVLLAGEEHDTRIANQERQRQRLVAALGGLDKQLASADQRLDSAQAKVQDGSINEQDPGSRNRWERQAQLASTQKARITQVHAEALQVLHQTESLLHHAEEAKRMSIDLAVGAELRRQKDARRQTIGQLTEQVANLRCEAIAGQVTQTELLTNMESEQAASEFAGKEAVTRELPRLLEEARRSAGQANATLSDAEARQARAKEGHDAAMVESARLIQQRESAFQQQAAEQASRSGAIQKQADEIQAGLDRLSTQHDLGISAPFTQQGILAAREERLSRIRQLCGNTAREVFIVDTSVLVERPDVLTLFTSDELVIVSKRVIHELDGLKQDENLRLRVTQAIKALNEHDGDGLQFCEAAPSLLPRDYPPVGDNLILSVALKYGRYQPVLLTNDNNLILKAKAEKIATMRLEDFERRATGRGMTSRRLGYARGVPVASGRRY